jgi:class 3 adenylate cyclase/tetratricopeptide (TPR) repeat protein
VPACPHCGKDNPEGFSFCGSCGGALGVASPRSEERKVVTVLFCDLVGFTSRSERADPEDVRATLREYHARMRTEIERFGGTVEKFIGDAVMAVFGAPKAHEDDAERAVRSALRILLAIEELNEASPGLDLAVRLGVNTGEAVVTLGARPEQGEGMVAGDVVNTAARLQSAAPVGGVVVGEATYRTTRDFIDYEAMEPLALKGKAEPVAVWRAVSARGRYGVDIDQTPSPFLGRDSELSLIDGILDRTLRESSAQLVTVTGEPGVGKSRLLWELRRRLDDRTDVLAYWRQGRCLPYGDGVTFWALGEVVKGLADILESDTPEQAAGRLDATLLAFVEDASERDWLRGRLAALVGAETSTDSQAVDREESFNAWRSFLEAVASKNPLILVFEDLHWADPSMLEFIDHLVEWSVGVPIMVIATARPELFERNPGWGGGKRNSTTLALSPLSEQDTARLVSALLSSAVLPAEVQESLLERAGGNPLYAEEFVRMLVDRGILEPRGRALSLAAGEAIPVPETVHALIAARLDTLSPERKSLLQDAAVLGKVFWSGALAYMSGGEERSIREGLHELARKELVRPARTSSVRDQAECSFWHALVRDVSYGQIPRAERATKHRLAAEWIESIAGDRVEDHAELLAAHYEQALELTRATGGTSLEELIDRTTRFLTLAGDRAARLDLGKSHEFYSRALGLTGPGHPDRPALLLKTVEAGTMSGRLDSEAEPMYTEAIEAIRSRGDARAAGHALMLFGRYQRVIGATEPARATLLEAVALLEAEPPSPELARAYASVAGTEMMAGRMDGCLEWIDKAMPIADQQDAKATILVCLQYRGIVRCAQGDVQGLDDLRESVAMGLELGLGRETSTGYNNLADWTSTIKDPAAGLAIYEEGIEFGQKHGLVGAAMWSRAETTWSLFDLGRWEEVLTAADEVLAWEEAHGPAQPGVIALTAKSRVLTHRGAFSEAARAAEDFLPAARRIHDLQVYWPALILAAHIAAGRGDLNRVVELCDELFQDSEGSIARGVVLPEAVRLLVRAGDVGRAERFMDRPAGAVIQAIHGGKTARAIIAEGRGLLAEALETFREAKAGWASVGFVPERGHCLLGAGRCLVGLGRPGEASGPLREAREIFAALGAQPYVEEADAWLERATALTS